MNSITTKLSGVTYGDAQQNIKIFGCKDVGSYALVREPDNPHDPHAIRVEIAGRVMGYIPRGIAKDLAAMMDAGRRFLALFVKRNEAFRYDTVGLTIEIVEVRDVSDLRRLFDQRRPADA